MNQITTNILIGIGSFLIGIPATLFLLLYSALAFGYYGLIVWLMVSILITYFLGKLAPSLGWKSGLLFSIAGIVVIIFLAMIKRIVDFGTAPDNLIWSSAIILLVILSVHGSRVGSRSKKNWQRKVPITIFVAIVLLLSYYTANFLFRGFRGFTSTSEVVQPVQPVGADKNSF